jgi:hypothetical protein
MKMPKRGSTFDIGVELAPIKIPEPLVTKSIRSGNSFELLIHNCGPLSLFLLKKILIFRNQFAPPLPHKLKNI